MFQYRALPDISHSSVSPGSFLYPHWIVNYGAPHHTPCPATGTKGHPRWKRGSQLLLRKLLKVARKSFAQAKNDQLFLTTTTSVVPRRNDFSPSLVLATTFKFINLILDRTATKYSCRRCPSAWLFCLYRTWSNTGITVGVLTTLRWLWLWKK